jgi:hypothetical protein
MKPRQFKSKTVAARSAIEKSEIIVARGNDLYFSSLGGLANA